MHYHDRILEANPDFGTEVLARRCAALKFAGLRVNNGFLLTPSVPSVVLAVPDLGLVIFMLPSGASYTDPGRENTVPLPATIQI